MEKIIVNGGNPLFGQDVFVHFRKPPPLVNMTILPEWGDDMRECRSGSRLTICRKKRSSSNIESRYKL